MSFIYRDGGYNPLEHDPCEDCTGNCEKCDFGKLFDQYIQTRPEEGEDE